MDERPGFRKRYLTLLLLAYQRAGFPKQADDTALEYIASLDDSTQMLFKDITLIATTGERLEYEKLDRWDRIAFARRFWQKRDPSPATSENERRVEHYRRVIHARQEFSEIRKPWDKRGDVYIRYGEPQHRSRWDNVRFEFHPDMVKVKDRLANQLPGPATREIIARSRRIRQSIREQEVGAGAVSDFEGVEFELNAARRSSERSGGEQRREGDANESASFTSLDRMGESEIRGLPLYPVEPDKPWEYWIYPYVGDGIEIVFNSLTYAEDFGFPGPPQGGRTETLRNTVTWTQKRPEVVVASAVKRVGERYVQPKPAIHYLSGQADFMADGKNTRLELYFGIPLMACVQSFRIPVDWPEALPCSTRNGSSFMCPQTRSGISLRKTRGRLPSVSVRCIYLLGSTRSARSSRMSEEGLTVRSMRTLLSTRMCRGRSGSVMWNWPVKSMKTMRRC